MIEQPVGEGELSEGEVSLGPVHYHLSVYRHFSDIESEPVPTHLEVEGRITPRHQLDLHSLHQRRAELTLRLADGRLLDFLVADEKGSVRSTGRGLHTHETLDR